MNCFLLDVNVLIALIDPSHIQHDAAHRWFNAHGRRGWATCPFTENGVLRIVGHPRYPNSPGTPSAVSDLMVKLRNHRGHAFWPDDLSLFDAKRARLLDSSQVSDTYLLALAKAHRGHLATFDRRLVPDAVIGGSQALTLIS
jgi:toxin-antitoxin system PIN domain toxin